MSEPLALRPVEFIDNYFPVIDGVTETVHEYARHMQNATVVCPAMESHYLQKHDFPYPVLTSVTARAPFSRYASAVPKIDRKLKAEIAQVKPDIFHLHSPSLLGKYAVSLGKKIKVPVVATFHSKYYDAIYEFTKSKTISKMVTGQIVKRLLQRPDHPTCLLLPDDSTALGAIQTITGLGLRVPEDISIAGYDGIPLSQMLRPTLTTIRQDSVSMGREAAIRLIDRIERPNTSISDPTFIKVEFLKGETFASVPGQQ